MSNADRAELPIAGPRGGKRRLRDTENRCAALRSEVESKDLVSASVQLQVGQRRTFKMEQELENNSVVFEMHYKELLMRNDEIQSLKATIEGLQAAGGG